MTESHEQELFRTLGNLVSGVKKIQETLDVHTEKLDEHTQKLNKHTKILGEHTSMLGSLNSKIDSIAGQVMDNDQRLTARITSVENAVGNLGGEIH